MSNSRNNLSLCIEIAQKLANQTGKAHYVCKVCKTCYDIYKEGTQSSDKVVYKAVPENNVL